jgi:hypothetical protein
MSQTPEEAPPKPKVVQHTLDEEIDEILKVVAYWKENFNVIAKNETNEMELNYRISALNSAANRLKALRYLMTNLHNPF